jgi:hypothetical protein
VAIIAIPPVALMILGARHIVERWQHFELNKGTELALAVVAAIAVVLLFLLVPAILRVTTDFFGRVRDRRER